MLKRVFYFIERKRAESFLESIRGWYQTCNQISTEIGEALHDQNITHQDIGAVIDKADRLLMNLSIYVPEARGLLRRRNPQLAQRVDLASRQVVQLRNEATRFLIRSQGPGPLANGEFSELLRPFYYYRALDEAGFKAREIKRRLDQDLKAIWQDLQIIIVQTEIMLTNHV